jgi:hypothetical protein
MKENKAFIFFIAMLFLFIGKDKEPLFEIVSIEYPKEIVIPKDLKGEELEDKIVEVHYRYNGENIVGESAHIHPWIRVMIYYFNKKGEILPEAFNFQRKYSSVYIGGKGWGILPGGVLFKRKQLFKGGIGLLDDFLFEHTEVDEAIQKKELSKIIVRINELEINWGVDEAEKNEYRIKINKTIKIKVRYER